MEQQFIRNPYKGQMDGEEHTFSMNVEPEYITLDPWTPTAWATLQVMQASHCPEVEQRWTHDYGKFQIRL